MNTVQLPKVRNRQRWNIEKKRGKKTPNKLNIINGMNVSKWLLPLLLCIWAHEANTEVMGGIICRMYTNEKYTRKAYTGSSS